jgi:hypothetical protein
MPSRSDILSVIAREAGVPVEQLAEADRLADVLGGSALRVTSDDESNGGEGAPEEVRLFLLATALEDAFGIDVMDHPEFDRLWLGTIEDLIRVVHETEHGQPAADA